MYKKITDWYNGDNVEGVMGYSSNNEGVLGYYIKQQGGIRHSPINKLYIEAKAIKILMDTILVTRA